MQIRNAKGLIALYPELRPWLSQCMVCHRDGYLPEIAIPSRYKRASLYLRRFFVRLDAKHLCYQCKGLQKLAREDDSGHSDEAEPSTVESEDAD